MEAWAHSGNTGFFEGPGLEPKGQNDPRSREPGEMKSPYEHRQKWRFICSGATQSQSIKGPNISTNFTIIKGKTLARLRVFTKAHLGNPHNAYPLGLLHF